jgi:hypothetical protein
MLTAISAPIFDAYGHVMLDVMPDSDWHARPRRVNRVPTLDGGAAVNDFGFSVADMTVSLKWKSAVKTTDAAVYDLVRRYGFLVLVNSEGVFLAAVEKYQPGKDVHTLTLLITEKLSA